MIAPIRGAACTRRLGVLGIRPEKMQWITENNNPAVPGEPNAVIFGLVRRSCEVRPRHRPPHARRRVARKRRHHLAAILCNRPAVTGEAGLLEGTRPLSRAHRLPARVPGPRNRKKAAKSRPYVRPAQEEDAERRKLKPIRSSLQRTTDSHNSYIKSVSLSFSTKSGDPKGLARLRAGHAGRMFGWRTNQLSCSNTAHPGHPVFEATVLRVAQSSADPGMR